MTDRQAPSTFREQLVALLPRLRRFAHGLARSEDEGDDLVQAACTRALERWEQWRPDTRLDSWLYRIIHTIWLDRVRANKVRDRFAGDRPDPVVEIDGVRQLDACMTLSTVRRLIDELPDGQRSVLMLVCVEGLSYREAAEVLHVPTGTIMSRLARARGTLVARMNARPSRGRRVTTEELVNVETR